MGRGAWGVAVAWACTSGVTQVLGDAPAGLDGRAHDVAPRGRAQHVPAQEEQVHALQRGRVDHAFAQVGVGLRQHAAAHQHRELRTPQRRSSRVVKGQADGSEEPLCTRWRGSSGRALTSQGVGGAEETSGEECTRTVSFDSGLLIMETKSCSLLTLNISRSPA